MLETLGLIGAVFTLIITCTLIYAVGRWAFR